eukprot:3232181-Rhodomonas_salina.1
MLVSNSLAPQQCPSPLASMPHEWNMPAERLRQPATLGIAPAVPGPVPGHRAGVGQTARHRRPGRHAGGNVELPAHAIAPADEGAGAGDGAGVVGAGVEHVGVVQADLKGARHRGLPVVVAAPAHHEAAVRAVARVHGRARVVPAGLHLLDAQPAPHNGALHRRVRQ